MGYCKPPKRSQFKPGKSGNPAGRPRQPKTTAAFIQQALSAKVPVRENGKVHHKSKIQVGLTQLANKAAGGDMRAILAVINLALTHEGSGTGSPDKILMREADRRVLDMMVERVRARTEGGSDEG